MELQLRIGQRVRRINFWDGRDEAQPTGPELTITQLFPSENFVICKLSDGRHDFEFNLVPLDLESNAFAAAAAPSAPRVAS